MSTWGWSVRCGVIPLTLALVQVQAWAQPRFDYEVFGRHVQEAQDYDQQAQALGESNPERRHELLTESSDAQQQAIELLHQALVGGVFGAGDRPEATARLLELNTSVIPLLVELGLCSQAQARLEAVLAEPELLPEGGQAAAQDLWPSVAGCVEYVAPAEPTPAEAAQPASAEAAQPAGQPSEAVPGPGAETPAPEEVASHGETGQGAAAPAEAAPEETVVVTTSPPRRPLRTAAWVTGSLAVACLAAAGGFYLHTQSLQDDLDAEVSKPRFDPAAAQSIWSDIQGSDDLMNVFLWSGVGLGATTVVLVALALVGHEETVTPVALPGGMGVGVGWAF